MNKVRYFTLVTFTMRFYKVCCKTQFSINLLTFCFLIFSIFTFKVLKI